jgi:Ankyrin repeats (3 copies)
MPTRSLPPRPDLDQLKRQARELRSAHAKRQAAAGARIAGHHPRHHGASPEAVLDATLSVADAQLVVAREYGFDSWPQLKAHAEISSRVAGFEPHPHFGEALEAFYAGDASRLRAMLAAHPSLVHARTNLEPPFHYFTGATLLHHVAGNPGDRRLPPNVVELTRVLLEAGADVEARTLGRSGGATMGLLVTSKQASDMDVSGPLMELLLTHGASLDLKKPDALDGTLANHAPRAAEKMIELGATPDIFAAAALGRMDLLRRCFDEEDRLLVRPRRHGRLMSVRDAIGLAMLYAYVRREREAVAFLLEKDGNWNMIGVNNGTALHRAAWDGDLDMVRRLVASGAHIHNRENPFRATPLSWAQHNRQTAVFDWLRTHCAIDLHDAVGFDLHEHVEARLREDPSSVNRRLDQWDIPQSTPLHWSCRLTYHDVDGELRHDPALRLRLVRRLLDAGADPDIVAGNGMAALDIAVAAGASDIARLLEQHHARRASQL